jgi:hypothetical protein
VINAGPEIKAFPAGRETLSIVAESDGMKVFAHTLAFERHGRSPERWVGPRYTATLLR